MTPSVWVTIVTGCVASLVGIIMLILWQTGIFPAHNRAMELRSTDRPEVKTSKDPDKSVNPIDLRSEEASTPVLKDTPVVIQSPSKVELDALIEKWLQVDNTELPVDSNRLQGWLRYDQLAQ